MTLVRVMLIAIDGPAGAGKSTVARALAARLGFTYLDSGAMYRCVALLALDAADGVRDAGGRSARRRGAIELGRARVLLDGRDVTEAIRTPEVSEAASRVAADPAVRAALVAKQRELIARGDWVAEGRDIGTVVAPDAELKVFLTAEPERARAPSRRRAGRRSRRRCWPSRRCATSATPRASTARSQRPRRGRARHDRPDARAGGRAHRGACGTRWRVQPSPRPARPTHRPASYWLEC